jgi:ubiquinone/menaquinone biosynthesis C-methylase UbiE
MVKSDRCHLRYEMIKVLKTFEIKSSRMLDIGCNDGTITQKVMKALDAREAYGIDIDQSALENLPSFINGVQFDLEKLGSEKMPFHSESFDFVLASEILEHLSYGDELIREAFRLLEPHSFLMITTPNLASLWNRLAMLFGFQPTYTAPSKYFNFALNAVRKQNPTDYGHKNLYTFHTLKKMLRVYGFDVISSRGAQMPYDAFSWFPFCRFPSVAPTVIILSRKRT